MCVDHLSIQNYRKACPHFKVFIVKKSKCTSKTCIATPSNESFDFCIGSSNTTADSKKEPTYTNKRIILPKIRHSSNVKQIRALKIYKSNYYLPESLLRRLKNCVLELPDNIAEQPATTIAHCTYKKNVSYYLKQCRLKESVKLDTLTPSYKKNLVWDSFIQMRHRARSQNKSLSHNKNDCIVYNMP
jgi:hypothetical protein